MRQPRPITWVPSLYFVQGLPYVIVNNVSVVVLKTLQVANAEIAWWTSSLSLIWAIKALWSPFVDAVGTKRRWTWLTQLLIAPALLLWAAALPTAWFLPGTIVALALVGLLSATHDVAADGLYLLGLDEDQQATYVGVRSTFWRLALVAGEGGLVVLAGLLGAQLGAAEGWAATIAGVAVMFGLSAAWHAWILPRPAADQPRTRAQAAGQARAAVIAFLGKPGLGVTLFFILAYRFAENHMAKLVGPFLLDPRDQGGLGLTLAEVGFAKGTVGVLALVAGGILGGVLIGRHGLRPWLWPMVIALNAPDLIYVWMAWAQPDDYALICALIGGESFGYGFGFTAYMVVLMRFAEGDHPTTHYAFATGLMALAVWLAQFWSGWAQAHLGYLGFFLWVTALTLPGAVAAWLVDPRDGVSPDPP